MPDIGYLPHTHSGLASPRRWTAGRVALIGAVAVGAALAALVTPAEEAARAAQAAGPELTRLLRAMAGMKALFAAGLLAAAYWRLAAPASSWRLMCYAAAASAMAAGPVLIWDVAFVRLGALLLHGGLVAGVLLLWRDPALAARLGAVVAGRRAMLAPRRRSQPMPSTSRIE